MADLAKENEGGVLSRLVSTEELIREIGRSENELCRAYEFFPDEDTENETTRADQANRVAGRQGRQL